MELTTIDWLLLGLLVWSGALVQGALGFGLAVIAAPFLLMIDPQLVPGPTLYFALVSALTTFWWNRRGIVLGELGLAFIARIPGTLLAMALLLVASVDLLAILLGTSVLLAVLVSIRTPQVRRTRPLLVLAGFMAGFMGTATSIAGPPMALVYQSADGAEMRANLAAFLILGLIMSLVGLVAIGHITRDQVEVSLLLTAPVIAGALAGRWVSLHLRPTWLRPAMLVLCAIAGTVAAADGVSGLLS